MLAVCLSLVAVQFSGLHMHVDSQGYAGAPEGTHVHGQPGHHHNDVTQADDAATHSHPGDDDHAGDKDVWIVKFGTAVSKLLLYLIALGLTLTMVLRPADIIAPRKSVPRPTSHHERWRPPLRTPPAFS
jgi:hypothetical protein